MDKNLAGVGLAFKIAEALLQTRPIAGLNVSEWLDLVAVGTVADIVPLYHENRAMVKAGLKLLNRRQRQGLLSLTGAAGLDSQKRLTARDIGFMIGPRLNAAGRMESAVASYQLLMALDEYEAGILAQKLDNQNRERQKMTVDMQRMHVIRSADERAQQPVGLHRDEAVDELNVVRRDHRGAAHPGRGGGIYRSAQRADGAAA